MAMLRAELINSCSHEKVAEAAILSIGGEFRDRVALLARASDVSTGHYAAQCVRRFAEEANEQDWESAVGRDRWLRYADFARAALAG